MNFSGRSRKRYYLIALLGSFLLVQGVGPRDTFRPVLVNAQSAAPDGVDGYHASDRERRKEQFEQVFGEMGRDQSINARVQFADTVLQKVRRQKHTSIEPYAYRRLRTLLKDHQKKPEALELLIKTVSRQQRLQGYAQTRQDRLLDLFSQMGQITRERPKRRDLVRRMLKQLHSDAREAITEHHWDRARTSYRRINGISSSFDHFFHAKSASRMMSRLEERVALERKTSKLMRSSSGSSDQPSRDRTAGRNLLNLGQWSHALMLLENANKNGVSTPLLNLARIGLTNQIAPLTTPEVQYRYLKEMASILDETSGDISVHRPITTGFQIVRTLQQNYDDLSEEQTSDISSLLQDWQDMINKNGPEPYLNIGDSPPLYFLYPRENLLLYAPGNGNAKDYSSYNHSGTVRFGSLVNRGAGILGAFQFTGAPDREENAIVFPAFRNKSIGTEFTIAFRFKRHRYTSELTSNDVGNMMLGIGRKLQIGTVGKFIQIYLDTANNKSTVQMGGGVKNRTWYHLALTYNTSRSNELRLFLNGSAAHQWKQFEGSLAGSPDTLSLGSDDKNRAPYAGLIDDVFLYNRSLNSDEIRSLYERSGTD